MKPLTADYVRRIISKLHHGMDLATRDYKNHLADIRKRCPHDWQYEPDSSENNDSEYRCSACGSTTRRLPK